MDNLQNLNVADLLKLAECLGGNSSKPSSANMCSKHPYEVGKLYIIRTVTMYHLGRLTEVWPNELVLEDASWVADTGRFHECVQKGTVREIEPFPEGRVVVGRGAIIDACVWKHDNIRTAK